MCTNKLGKIRGQINQFDEVLLQCLKKRKKKTRPKENPVKMI